MGTDGQGLYDLVGHPGRLPGLAPIIGSEYAVALGSGIDGVRSEFWEWAVPAVMKLKKGR